MKAKIADTLVAKLEHKPLGQVTVKEICEELDISRQTFYYYFHDIYEIVEWIFESESDMILRGFSAIDSWQFGYALMMKWMQDHRSLVINCYRSVRRDYVQNFMNRVLLRYIDNVVHIQANNMDVTEEQKKFIARFFTLAINAISLDWIGEGMCSDPTVMAEQVNILIHGDFQKALSNFEKDNQTKKA